VAEFVCGVRETNPNYLSACKNLPEYRDTGYCVLHYSGEEKREDFEQVKKDKLEREDYDFSGTVFPEDTSDFSRYVFEAHVSFEGARFSGKETDFTSAQFGSAEISFWEATFAKEVYFTGVTFSEKVTFWGTHGNRVFGPGAWAQFDRPRIEKPEQFTFNTVLLHPGWFINADVRKVDFTDVQWVGMPGGPEGTIEAEVKALEEREVDSPHTLLSQACRRLSANAEDNREYSLANEFHYWSMDADRKREWRFFKDKTWRDLLKREYWPDIARHFGLITTLYWALSGYGVRAARAFWMLAAIWAAFTILYVLVDPSEFKDFGQGIAYRWQAAVYSLLALVRLNPEPRPEEPGVFQFLVGLEGILGPLQIALLALAIRRKVMR
jgi:hypothetical protein